MRIHILLTNPSFFTDLGRDNCNEVWIKLKNTLEKNGFSVTFGFNDNLIKCDKLIYLDSIYLYRNIYDFFLKYFYFLIKNPDVIKYLSYLNKNTTINKSAILLLEPPSILKNNINKKYYKDFRYVFSWNKDVIKSNEYFIQSPCTSIFPKLKKRNFKDKKLLVDISANKFSNHKDELYSYRRELVSYLDNEIPKDFDLFGSLWNKKIVKSKFFFNYLFKYKKIKSYKGYCDSKFQTISKYKFCLCIENMWNINDYISQRLFDILHSNCVPIYLGASNIENYIPKKCFIDLRDFNNNFSKLLDKLISINEIDYQSYLDSIKVFLNSNQAKLFYSNYFANTITNKLKS